MQLQGLTSSLFLARQLAGLLEETRNSMNEASGGAEGRTEGLVGVDLKITTCLLWGATSLTSQLNVSSG